MKGIKIRNLTKKFSLKGREISALNRISMDVRPQSFVTIVGKSGCGKTTFLRILCGLEEKSEGEVIYNDWGKPPKISMVFQEPRLMPWLTVKQNMGFSLQKGKDGIKAEETVQKYLDILDMAEFQDAYPNQISGGMAQRTALGRTLCHEPDLILMDEPLGALDACNRRILQDELIHIFKSCRKTIIFVTHDIDEALYLGQRLVIMDKGSILDEMDLGWTYPRDMNSAEFLRMRGKVLETLMDSGKRMAVAQ